MTEQYQGACHCGAVRFSFTGETIRHGLRCNCSLCSRRGAMMTPYVIPPQDFAINADADVLGLYQFGLKTAKHYFCKQCGIYTFHVTARKADHYRVNLACIEGLDSTAFTVEVFDGKHLL